jgi:hypothetical protein
MSGLVAYGSSDEEDDEQAVDSGAVEKVGASTKVILP